MAITRWQPFGGIKRWEPFAEIDTLQKEMNRLLDQLAPSGNDNGFSFLPSAEIDETDNEVHLKLEVPGVRADDLDIEVTNEAVTVRGERKSESKTEEKGGFRSEFYYGHFERTIPMPTPIEKDRVSAEYKDGLLCLTVPKAPKAGEEAIKVKVA
jgi:HSP20 family protein